jgi:hypothetical protein
VALAQWGWLLSTALACRWSVGVSRSGTRTVAPLPQVHFCSLRQTRLRSSERHHSQHTHNWGGNAVIGGGQIHEIRHHRRTAAVCTHRLRQGPPCWSRKPPSCWLLVSATALLLVSGLRKPAPPRGKGRREEPREVIIPCSFCAWHRVSKDFFFLVVLCVCYYFPLQGDSPVPRGGSAAARQRAPLRAPSECAQRASLCLLGEHLGAPDFRGLGAPKIFDSEDADTPSSQ